MINVYLISGFLGSGKTTFIQKLLKEKKFTKVMLLENEFGEVGVDSAFFDSGLKVREINNGCICCSLQGDFESALEEIEGYGISDLIIEPSGVGKLSEIIKVIAADDDFRIVCHICIVDVKTCIKYHKNFKEYFDDQVSCANALVLSHLDVAEKEQIQKAVEMLREINDDAVITDKPVNDMSMEEIMDIIVKDGEICPECFEDDDDDDECCCGHHHHHHHEEGEECCCGHHHDDDDDDECCCHHEHEHHHHDDEDECCCGHHHHGHHHDDEDELFKNCIFRPEHIFTEKELEDILSKMDEDIIRVKGYVKGEEGTIYFNYILNEYHIYKGEKRDGALIVVIGTKLDKEVLKEAFHG